MISAVMCVINTLGRDLLHVDPAEYLQMLLLNSLNLSSTNEIYRHYVGLEAELLKTDASKSAQI